MNLNEQEMEQFLGGAPKEVVKEFSKPGEIQLEDMDSVMGGLNYQVAVEAQKDSKAFSEEVIQRESALADMLKDVNKQTPNESTHQVTK